MPIALDSLRWQELPSCWNDQRLIGALHVFLEEKDSGDHAAKERDRALCTINDSIFHQTSTYPATYITVPHLVGAIDQLSEHHQLDVVKLVAWISIQGEPHGELTSEEIQEYTSSLRTLAKKTEIVFREAKRGDTWSMVTLLASFAVLRGAPDLWRTLYHGVEEQIFNCPECKTELMSTGYAVSKVGSDSQEYLQSDDGSPQCWLPIHRTVTLDEKSEKVTPRDEFPKSSSVAPLLELVTSTNRKRLEKWLMNYFGYSRCPSCGHNLDLLTCFLISE